MRASCGHNILPRLSPALYPSLQLGKFEIATLVPGGRFLFTATTGLVQLWDLGFSPESMIRERPVVSMLVEGLWDEWQLCLQPTSDGEGIVMLLPYSLQTTKFVSNFYICSDPFSDDDNLDAILLEYFKFFPWLMILNSVRLRLYTISKSTMISAFSTCFKKHWHSLSLTWL